MPTATANLVDVLRRHKILDDGQSAEAATLQTRYAEPKALAGELLQRGWLTPYQVNQLLQGRGANLVIGPYVLLERLGEGGMGQVFKARHQVMDRVVALKVIRKDYLNNSSAMLRFQREIKAAAALAHPNIITAHDAGQVADTWLFAMEYVEGTDLAKLVKTSGPLAVEQACDYIRQAAWGLQHAFERGLVHRDIKPGNLLVSRDGIVKVLDMGLARLHGAEDEDGIAAATAAGAVMGTPDYIAPEQARNSHQADIRSDLYSLGCTFYVLLTGKVPFPSGTLTEKLIKHQMDAPTPIESLRPDVPAGLAALIGRLMAKKPEDRPQTPAELAAELEPYCPTTAIQVGAKPRSTPTVAAYGQPTPIDRRPPVARRGLRLSAWLAIGGVAVLFLGGILLGLILGGKRPGIPSAPVASTGKASNLPSGIDEEWLQLVEKMPPDRQVAAVTAKLKDLNPGFEGTLEPAVDGGVVVRIRVHPGRPFSRKGFTNIAPLYAFRDIRELQFLMDGRDAPISDLTPLQGSKLEVLSIPRASVRDLGQLRGLPLRSLDVSFNPILDLGPLQGMPLTHLNCSHTKVTYLTALKGMPLRDLNVSSTGITELTPLEGMKLTHLNISQTGVTSIKPLHGMPLQSLEMTACRVNDLTPLRGMPLRTLSIAFSPATDLSFLQGMRLEFLDLRRTNLRDFSVLRGMPLRRLYIESQTNRDYEPLRQIKTLDSINERPPEEFFKKADK